MSLKVKKRVLLPTLIILFPIFQLIGGVFSSYDEIIGLIAAFYVFFTYKKQQFNKNESVIIIILVILTLIGLISNFVSGLIKEPFPIIVDIVFLWKTFSCFLLFAHVSRRINNRETELRVLAPLSKLTIILNLFLSLIGQFINVGVVNVNKTYMGIKQYGFFWNNSIQTGWMIICALLILSASIKKKREFYRYLMLSSVPLLLTFSSLVYCWLFTLISLLIFLKENRIFKKRYFVFLGIGVAFFAFTDIYNYYYNESVRVIFLKYGAITANTYFPLGSGFATFGSEMASRYYSPLYVKYGWESLWALGRSGKYLNDNFFAGILGQFGWIGLLMYFICLYHLLKCINTIAISRMERCTCIATVICIAVVMIGSAAAKTMMGVCTFSVLGIVYSKTMQRTEITS